MPKIHEDLVNTKSTAVCTCVQSLRFGGSGGRQPLSNPPGRQKPHPTISTPGYVRVYLQAPEPELEAPEAGSLTPLASREPHSLLPESKPHWAWLEVKQPGGKAQVLQSLVPFARATMLVHFLTHSRRRMLGAKGLQTLTPAWL